MNQGPTITLFKSTKGKVFGGYLHIHWKEKGGHTKDDKAFLFSLDSLVTFTPTNTDKAAYFDNGVGPCFGANSITVESNQLMNATNNCSCYTKGINEFYNVSEDAEGNSILTGDGKATNNKFTLSALETWAVTY